MKVGVIGAMKEEVALLVRTMSSERVVSVAGRNFYEGSIGDTAVVVVQSGIGKVNAALCTQILIDRFEIDCVINTGIAGLLVDDLIVGDVVVSSDCVQHDIDVHTLGYPQGQIPGIATFSFPADTGLCQQALDAVEKVAPYIKAMQGRIVSGDEFVADASKAEELRKFGEGSAIAQVAWLNDLPFVIVRLMSDKPGVSSQLDYATFERTASQRCAEIVLQMVKQLSYMDS